MEGDAPDATFYISSISITEPGEVTLTGIEPLGVSGGITIPECLARLELAELRPTALRDPTRYSLDGRARFSQP